MGFQCSLIYDVPVRFQLVSVFKDFGTIKDFEFMWHTHGPRRGEPRGYCFVEYQTRTEAEKAVQVMNGKLLHGRNLMVRFALDKVHHTTLSPWLSHLLKALSW